MRLLRGIVLGLLIAGTFVWATGCKVFDASLLPDGGEQNQDSGEGNPEAGPGEAGPGEAGTADGGDDSGTGVALEGPPPRPDVDDGDSQEPVVFALKDVLLDQINSNGTPAPCTRLDCGEKWRETGYDLDGLDTGPNNGFAQACQSDNPIEDGVRGIDNAFGGKLWTQVSLVFGNREEPLQVTAARSLAEGLGTILLRVSNWDGTKNDPNVKVEAAQTVFATHGGIAGGDPETEPEIVIEPEAFEGGGATAHLPGDTACPPCETCLDDPKWEGNDWFWVRDDNYGSDGSLTITDRNAYVSDGWLVVDVPDNERFVLTSGNEGVAAEVTDGVAAGKLNEDNTKLDPVILAGRWQKQALIDTANALGVCPDQDMWGIVLNTLESNLDVASNPTNDNAGIECSAMSVGIQFTGYRANWATQSGPNSDWQGAVEGPHLPDQCEDPPPPDGGVRPECETMADGGM